MHGSSVKHIRIAFRGHTAGKSTTGGGEESWVACARWQDQKLVSVRVERWWLLCACVSARPPLAEVRVPCQLATPSLRHRTQPGSGTRSAARSIMLHSRSSRAERKYTRNAAFWQWPVSTLFPEADMPHVWRSSLASGVAGLPASLCLFHPALWSVVLYFSTYKDRICFRFWLVLHFFCPSSRLLN
jgi:hypothetical protein